MIRTIRLRLVKTAVLLACLIGGALSLFGLPGAAAAGAPSCVELPDFTVTTAFQLSYAINCINGAGTGTYSITLQNDLILTSSTPAITNTAATSIAIDGNIAFHYAVIGGTDIRPFEIDSGVTVIMQNLVVRDGSQTAVSSPGAGILNKGDLTLDNTVVRNNHNSTGDGGGIFSGPGSTLTIQNGSLISGNGTSSDGTGGGIASDGGAVTIRDSAVMYNASGAGAGLFASYATVLISDSTISDNDAIRVNAIAGGIYHNEGELTIINSTISDNSAATSSLSGTARAGGIYAVLDDTQMDTTLINTTVSGNVATGGGASTFLGGGLVQEGGALTLHNSILAGNTTGGSSGGDCETISSPTVDGQHSLIEDAAAACGLTNGVDGNIIDSAADLLPLDDYGGSTLTRPLGGGSPAIDAGDNALAVDESSSPLTVDQRGAGFPRVINTTVDMGAVETAACPSFPLAVASGPELNVAIGCYNALAAPGTYTIALTADILLATTPTVIDNANTGVALLLDGAGFALDADNNQALVVAPDTAVTVQDLEIHSGEAEFGGAILNEGALALNSVYLATNFASVDGGGIYNLGELAINGSKLENNNASNGQGGALYNAAGASASIAYTTLRQNGGEDGGGVFNDGSLVVSSSTFHVNTSQTGGAIANVSAAPVVITNSTFSRNSSNFGGAINNDGGDMTITNSTFADGYANGEASAIRTAAAGEVTLNNSIIANAQLGADCVATSGGTFSGASNLIDDFAAGDCSGISSAAVTNFDPVLADNGGPTATHALLAGSSALDAGSNLLAVDENLDPLTTDQRGPGFPRIQAGTVDVGAVEGPLLCSGFPAAVANAMALNDAIYCFNQETTPDTYVINVAADIDLTQSTRVVENTEAGVELDIQGHGYTVDGQGAIGLRPFEIAPGTTAAINDLTITGGTRNGVYSGGTLALNNSTVTANTGDGGGVFNDSGDLTVTFSTISDNTDMGSGGGGVTNAEGLLEISASTITGNTGLVGGVLILNGPALVTNSTIANNEAIIGGGIFNYAGQLLAANSTFSGNVAQFDGGGLYNTQGATAVVNSTFSGNSAVNGGGVLTEDTFIPPFSADFANRAAVLGRSRVSAPSAPGDLTLDNTIITGSTGGDCLARGTGTIAGNENNLVDEYATGDCSAVSSAAVTNFDTTLAGNGGPTQTHMILPGSNAIENGDPPACATAELYGADQRFVTRPQGTFCDIGAVEATAQAALSGVVALQGRAQPGTPGTVTISDTDMGTSVVPFDPVTGVFSFPSVPVAAGGTNYEVTAVHSLYLANQLPAQATAADDDLDLGTTTLSGGDANNDGTIDILDLGCMGSAYNTPGSSCGGAGGTDINADGITNIQDLGIAGGNYQLVAPQPWVPVP